MKAKASDKLIDYTNSIKNDSEFFNQDIDASIAHVKMLGKCNIISKSEKDKIACGLEQIRDEITHGTFVWDKNLEDIHMNIETRLTQLIGKTAKKLHTARSRNDQIATDFRLFTRNELTIWQSLLLDTIGQLNKIAEKNVFQIMPGYTHLQPAQPISFAHYLQAYVQMFTRDYKRVADCLIRADVSPLGACALGGTTHKIDARFTACQLGFSASFENSIDAVSDRDFVCDALFCSSMIMMHLSRLCEDFILFVNPAFGFVKISQSFTTGSSIMPQKQNPDILELARGKTGICYGNLVAMLTLMKALPMSYNRDMQNDKEIFSQSNKNLQASLRVVKEFLKNITFNNKKMEKAMDLGYLNATELADWLVKKGVAFREAYNTSQQIVQYATAKKVSLQNLTLDELKGFSSEFDERVFEALDYKRAVEARNSDGGTGFEQVREQIEKTKKWLLAVKKDKVSKNK